MAWESLLFCMLSLPWYNYTELNGSGKPLWSACYAYLMGMTPLMITENLLLRWNQSQNHGNHGNKRRVFYCDVAYIFYSGYMDLWYPPVLCGGQTFSFLCNMTWVVITQHRPHPALSHDPPSLSAVWMGDPVSSPNHHLVTKIGTIFPPGSCLGSLKTCQKSRAWATPPGVGLPLISFNYPRS